MRYRAQRSPTIRASATKISGPKLNKRINRTLDRVEADYLADAVTYVDPVTGERRTSRFQEMCDFCTQRGALPWTYPCGLVDLRAQMNPLMTHSNDDWAACERCHELIEAGDIEGLIARMLEKTLGEAITDMSKLTLVIVRGEIRKHLARFTAARTGPAVREPDAR